MKDKVIMSHLFFILIAAAILYFKVAETYLIWNMFLALVALDAAFCLNYLKQTLPAFFIGLLWFFFYPNTFYMLTDLVHMDFAPQILSDQNSLLLYFLFLASILFGVLCGVESFRQVLRRFPVKNISVRWLIIILLSFLSSLAIHLGRFARLNSWDMVLRPSLVLDELSKLLSFSNLPFLLGFTFIQVMVLCFLNAENTK